MSVAILHLSIFLKVVFMATMTGFFLTACAGNGGRGVNGTEASEIPADVVYGENFSAQVFDDGTLILDLDANTTTGYTWIITEEPDNFASDYDTYVEQNHTNQIVGTGGISEFHIIALKEGTGTMIFQYKRPWDGGEVAGTYGLTLTISRNQTGLRIDSVSFEQIR